MVVGAYFMGRQGSAPSRSRWAGAPDKATPSPSISPSRDGPREANQDPVGVFGETGKRGYGKPRGKNLILWAVPLETGGECTLHMIDGVGAYHSDCASWSSSGIDIYTFFVGLENKGNKPFSRA